MTGQGLLQLALYVVVLVALVKPLGAYMAAVFRGERTNRTGRDTRSTPCW